MLKATTELPPRMAPGPVLCFGGPHHGETLAATEFVLKLPNGEYHYAYMPYRKPEDAYVWIEY
jgi:hypothetical protein